VSPVRFRPIAGGNTSQLAAIATTQFFAACAEPTFGTDALRASFASAAAAIFFCGICALCSTPVNAQTLEEDTEAVDLEPLQSLDVTDGLPPNSDDEPDEDQSERAWGDWRVRIGAVLLARPDPPALNLNRYLAYKEELINSADVNIPIGPATDVSLRLPGSVVDVDFRYFGVSQAVANTGPMLGTHGEERYTYVNINVSYDLGRPFVNYSPDFGSATMQFSKYVVEIPYETRVSLASWLQSAELNLRREVHPSIAFLAGFRYVQFREKWELRQDAPLGRPNNLDHVARNDLFGFQIGSEALLFSFNRLRFESAFKAGIFGNVATNSSFGAGSSEYISYRWDLYDRRGALAFVGDVNVSAGWQLTRNVSVRGGYQLLWLTGVATATDQLKGFNYPRDIETDGSTFFHGAMVGLECGW